MECKTNASNENNANLNIIRLPTNEGGDSEVPPILNNMEQSLQQTVADSTSVAVAMASNNESKIAETTENAKETKEGKSKKSHHRDDKFKVTFRTHLTSLAHVSVLVFVYLILKLAFRGEFVFFTWHPILMSVGWMLLMTEGFYAINKYNTYWRMKTTGGFRVKIHLIVISIGYVLSLIGYVVVFLNKENLGKKHLVTWHGLFGLIALICTLPPVINGFLLWYKKELVNFIKKPRLLKFVHVTSGTLAFTFGALALVVSVYSNWYGKKSYHSNSAFYFGLITVSYPVLWAIYGPSVKLANVIREYFFGDKED